MANNEVTNFMYYIFNRWTERESRMLFGDSLGEHVWKKYLCYMNSGFGELKFYAELDSACKQKMVDRANEIYGGSE